MNRWIIAFVIVALCYVGSALAAVNVNTAGANELSKLSGIGPVKAQAIVKDRKQHGDYKSVEQLTRVRGIGEKTVDNLKSQATVGSNASSQASR